MDTILGRIELDLDKADSSLREISVAIKGATTAVGQEAIVFLDLKQVVWSAGDTLVNKLPTGKHLWHFKMTFPKEVCVPDTDGKPVMHPLPPNLSERASPVYIDYKFEVTFKRVFLRPNQLLSPFFAFIPYRSPEPPSPLRLRAYREGTDVPGPDMDPDGWHVCSPGKINGTLFNARQVDVLCTLFIAKPLCYAVRTHIPMFLTFTSTDSQALDVFARPDTVNLSLIRLLTMGSSATQDKLPKRSNNLFTSNVGSARFWTLENNTPKVDTRVLEGELELKSSLKPSFVFPRVTLSYSLDLQSFSPPGFAPTESTTEPYISQKVDVVIQQVPGVKSVSRIPPGYEVAAVNDYTSTMGLLENGNQRFNSGHRTGF